MKNVMIISSLFLLVLIFGCGGDHKNNATQEKVTSDSLLQKSSAEKESDEESAGKLVLNNGLKWQANRETTEGIQNMQKRVDEYIANAGVDHKLLSENLEKEFSTIFEKCTMTGEAHTQLHNYLLPLRDRIGHLKEKGDTESVKSIQSYLAEYLNYFQ
ncbi:MAG: hypothetical protein ABJB16_03165 [Saprospiraceae bacterium]